VDDRDRENINIRFGHVEITAQERQIANLETRKDHSTRIQSLENWKASQTASGLRNVIIGGAFVLIAGIIVTFLAFYLRL
jgi:hypothetical protein